MQMKPELEASSQTTILHILALLKDIMYIFPKECIKVVLSKIIFLNHRTTIFIDYFPIF